MHKQRQRRNGKLNGVQIIQWLLYADDLVIFCKNVAEAEKIMNILHETCYRFGLNISFQKTKTQVFNNEELANMPSLFAINGEVIENSRTLVNFPAIKIKKTSLNYMYQKQFESLMKSDRYLQTTK